MRALHTLAIAAIALPVAVQQAAAEVREESSRTWDAQPIASVLVDNPQGLVTVHPSRDGRIHLIAYKIVREGTTQEMKDLASKTRVEIDDREGRLSIRVRYPDRPVHISVWDVMQGHGIARVEVRLGLETPATLPVILKSSSGDLQTAGLAGAQDVESHSGDITIAEATGPLDASTRSGAILLTKVAGANLTTSSGDVDVDAASGSLRIETASGTVRLGVIGGPVVASSTSGDVHIRQARSAEIHSSSGDVAVRSAGSVTVETSSGSAHVDLDSGVTRADVSTNSGDVTLRLASALGCRVDLQSSSGSVDLGRVKASVQSLAEGHMIATLGDGKVPVVLRSSSGNLNLVQ